MSLYDDVIEVIEHPDGSIEIRERLLSEPAISNRQILAARPPRGTMMCLLCFDLYLEKDGHTCRSCL